jgi:hypothetical protein
VVANDASIVQDRQVELAEPFGVGEELDLDDPAVGDGEPKTTRGWPPGAQTAPAAPSTSAGRANRARPEKVPATSRAPRTSAAAPACTAAGSARSTTSGSSRASHSCEPIGHILGGVLS